MEKHKNLERYYVYQLRLEYSETPFYIGKGSRDRFKEHFRKDSLEKISHKNNVIKKAYKEGVKILTEILCTGMTHEDAIASEEHLIRAYGRRCNDTGCLVNISEGGIGPNGALLGRKQTSEHVHNRFVKIRARMKPKAITRKRGEPFTEEHKQNLSIAASKTQIKRCEHCSLEMKLTQYKRYHGDKCKSVTKEVHTNRKIAGEANKSAKLCEEDIREIRKLVESGMSKAAVGRLYNIGDSHVCNIIQRKSWAHVV